MSDTSTVQDSPDEERNKLFPELGGSRDDQDLYFGLLVLLVILGAVLLLTRCTGATDAIGLGGVSDSIRGAVGGESTDVTITYGEDGTITLEGTVPDQETSDALEANAVAEVGESNVTNNLKIDSSFTNDNGKVTLVGTVATAAAVTAVGEAFPSIGDFSLDFANELNFTESDQEVAEPDQSGEPATATTTAAPATTTAPGEPATTVAPSIDLVAADVTSSLADGKITLTGTIPDEATRAALVAAAATEVGDANVIDELVIDEASTNDGGQLVVTGEVASEEAKAQKIADAQAAADAAGLELVDNVTVQSVADVINEALALDPIQFDYNSSNITAASRTTLDNAIAVLEASPDVRVEIGGHTDSDGGDAANLILSDDRANAVRQYLIDGGIAADRLEAKGYGEAEPVATNDTDEGKAQNRRIEFTEL